MPPIIPPDLSDLDALRIYLTQLEMYIKSLEDKVQFLETRVR